MQGECPGSECQRNLWGDGVGRPRAALAQEEFELVAPEAHGQRSGATLSATKMSRRGDLVWPFLRLSLLWGNDLGF